MFLSIIVPVYNVVDYLTECVESIYNFHIVNPKMSIELILIDDGSSDGSGNICDQYANDIRNNRDFTVIVVHQNNKGVSVARNVGLDNAHGEWIWFVDADDYVESNMIEIPHADVIMFGCKWIKSDNTEQIFPQDDCINCSKNTFLKSHYSFLNQTMWFKKELIQKYSIQFTEGMKMGEDLEWQFKYLMMCENPCSLSYIIYNYRIVEGSASNNVNSRKNIVNDSNLLFDNLLSFIKLYLVNDAPWLSERLSRQIKTMLYSAGQADDIIYADLQKSVRYIFDSYKNQGFSFMKTPLMKLAYLNVGLYIFINKVYLKLKS